MEHYGNYKVTGKGGYPEVRKEGNNGNVQQTQEDTLLSKELANVKSNSEIPSGEEVVSYKENCNVKGIDGNKHSGTETIIRKADGTEVTKKVYTDSSGTEVSIEESSKKKDITYGNKVVPVTYTRTTTNYGGKPYTIVENEECSYDKKTTTTTYNTDGSAEIKSETKLKKKLCKIPPDVKKGRGLGSATIRIGSFRDGRPADI